MWCLAHRYKGCSSFFDELDDILLRLYYIKSPKNAETIITDLKECSEFNNQGAKLICGSGSRWVCHKQNAMKRILSKYVAYTNHNIQPSV